jgi:ParB family chromosome partitioning protein
MAKFVDVVEKIAGNIGTTDRTAVLFSIMDIPIEDILVKENIRKEYTDIEELAESICQYGLLQPIMVYSDGDDKGNFIVKTGHRRFQAYQLLCKKEPDRFNKIRCMVSDANNIAVVQLVENVQRENLSQLDLFNALNSLKAEGMTLKQIADVMGKSEKSVKNLFVGVNEMNHDEDFQKFLDSPGAGTIQDIIETKGIPDKKVRLELLEQRKNGEISQKELRKKVKGFKDDNTAMVKVLSVSGGSDPQKISVCLDVMSGLKELLIYPSDKDNALAFETLRDDITGFLSAAASKYVCERKIKS